MSKKYVDKFNIGGEDIYVQDSESSQKKTPAKLYSIGKVVGLEAGRHTFDWSFIVTPSGKVLMFDTGAPNSTLNVNNILSQIGVDHVDFIYISHYDTDHCGNMAYLLSVLNHEACVAYVSARPRADKVSDTVNANYNSTIAALTNAGVPVTMPNSGDVIEIGEVKIKFYNADFQRYYDSENFLYNNCCLCCIAEYDGDKIFFSGDIQAEAENYLGTVLDHCSIVKYSHHAYNRFIEKNYFDALSPTHYFVTNGDGIGNNTEDTVIMDYHSVENCNAQVHNVPTYCTSTAPGYILKIEFGNGVFNVNTNAYPNKVTGVVDTLSFVELFGKGKSAYDNLSVLEMIQAMDTNRRHKSMIPSGYGANIMHSNAIFEMDRITGGSFPESFSGGKERRIGSQLATGTDDEPQKLSFYQFDADGVEHRYLHNDTSMNFYRFKIDLSSTNLFPSLTWHIGSDMHVDTAHDHEIVTDRHFLGKVNIEFNYPTTHTGASKFSFNNGDSHFIHYLPESNNKHIESIEFMSEFKPTDAISIGLSSSVNVDVHINVYVICYKQGYDDSSLG